MDDAEWYAIFFLVFTVAVAAVAVTMTVFNLQGLLTVLLVVYTASFALLTWACLLALLILGNVLVGGMSWDDPAHHIL